MYKYPWQTVDMVDVYSDTDWAGCIKTRKSTSGGCIMLGSHLLKSWASTQSNISLSSGEAEFYGVVKAAGAGLGYEALLEDLGVKLPVRVWTDSTATIGICKRQGLGKLRHIDTQCLWIQQRVRDQSITLMKVRGEDNPADLFTKHLSSSERIEKLLKLFGCIFQDGRSALAPTLRSGKGDTKGELLALKKTRNKEHPSPRMFSMFPEESAEATGETRARAGQVRPVPDVDPSANGSKQMEKRWADSEDDEVGEVFWNGRWYPKAFENDGTVNHQVPDAHATPTLQLPHLHPRLDHIYPCATSCPPLPETEVPEDTSLEAIGWRKGVGLEEPLVAMAVSGTQQQRAARGSRERQRGFVRLKVVEAKRTRPAAADLLSDGAGLCIGPLCRVRRPSWRRWMSELCCAHGVTSVLRSQAHV